MLLGFGLEQGSHEVEGRESVSLGFSLHSVKAHSLILGNWGVSCLFCCGFVVGFLVWFLRCCFTLDTIEVQTKELLIKS